MDQNLDHSYANKVGKTNSLQTSTSPPPLSSNKSC